MNTKQLRQKILDLAIRGKLVPPACRQAGKTRTMNPFPKPESGAWFVYVIECEDGSFYKGFTADLAKRYEEHCDGVGSDWTKRHKPKQLFYWEKHYSKQKAIEREKYLKSGVGREWFTREVVNKPDDWEPASVLLERIRAEKERLVKEGKIKRDKNESIIFRDSDRLHYEQFEIPDSWAWATIKDICLPSVAKRPEGQEFRYIDIDAIDNRRHAVADPKIVSVAQAPSRAAREVAFGDTLFSMVRPYLENIAFITSELGDCIASTGFYVCRPNQTIVTPKFLYYYMISTYTVDGLNAFMRGDNSPSIRANELEGFHFPLPPIKEQKHIVTAIETAMPVIDEIDRNKSDLQAAVAAAKSKILSLAIHGKLVPQDPNDEPASVLLERIRAERESLIKAGKITCPSGRREREKGDSAIVRGDDNSYYLRYKKKEFELEDEWLAEIPNTWEVCVLEQLSYSIASKPFQIFQSEITNIGKLPVISQSVEYIEGYSDDIERKFSCKSPIIIFGDHTRNIKYVDFDFVVGADGVKIICPIALNEKYFYYCLNFASSNIVSRGYSRHFQFLEQQPLPIPPIAEQYRIVAAIKSVFEQLDRISAMLE
ncbi:hypothetical protein FACS1894189_1160 [Planctomycetales bacterium]|nr:hypothetical protein FACS1894189_1160 [Planctomycetales bacterium]